MDTYMIAMILVVSLRRGHVVPREERMHACVLLFLLQTSICPTRDKRDELDLGKRLAARWAMLWHTMAWHAMTWHATDICKMQHTQSKQNYNESPGICHLQESGQKDIWKN